MTARKIKLALVQFTVRYEVEENLKLISKLIKEAVIENKPHIVALPECCNSPYGNQFFNKYAESVNDGKSVKEFSRIAKENKIYLIAGSIPERENGKLYNTTTVFEPNGNCISKFRKIHLFDIDVKGKFSFQESKTLSAGDDLVMFNAYGLKIGLGICYDMRFADMANLYANAGCQLLVYPGAFSMATGPSHWELLARARALDNQCYVAAISPSRVEDSPFVAYGHSLVVSPWGDIVAKAEEKDKTVYAEIDLDHLEEVRSMIPIRKQKKELKDPMESNPINK